MTAEDNILVEQRILQLLKHLGIERAHFASRSLGDLTGLAARHAEIIASLTLVCPATPQRELISPLASRLLVFRGDDASFDSLAQLVDSLPEVTVGMLHGYVAWSDLIARHKDEIQKTMLAFLQSCPAVGMQKVALPDGKRGEIAGITYEIQGEGPPLVLFPLGFVPSQWDPILPALTRNFCTITLGGAELGIIALLEKRATVTGYLDMVRTLTQAADVAPSDSILEVGCGTGALTRWLADYTKGQNEIFGVDINRYLLREAENLARSKGFAGKIQFEPGNAEDLPYPDHAFDMTMSVTVMEEVDADKMLAEMIRVTKPGGKVAVIVRASDIPFFINMPLGDDLKAKVENPKKWVSAAPNGCADASLYQRFQASSLTDVKMFPYLVAFTEPWAMDFVQASVRPGFNPAEAEKWQAARARTEAEGTFVWSYPHHCVVGTLPG